jgi:catechol 2,3-dioxygenase-like lactoylglutathione lyase family enzyme
MTPSPALPQTGGRLALDHLVIAVRDRERAIQDYRALGFTVAIGGRHAGRTSHNALVVFADGAYLELIAWDPPNPSERWSALLDRHGEGFIDFALLPGNTGKVIAEAKARGLDLDGPLDGGRVRPDGKELRWQTARQPTFDLPFLCGDVTPREWRVPEGDVREHANDVTGISGLTVAVADLGASVERYRALLGTEEVQPPAVLGGAGLRVASFDLGSTTLFLASPTGATASGLARRVATQLDARGDGLCAAAFRSRPGQARALDLSLTHGALFEVDPS